MSPHGPPALTIARGPLLLPPEPPTQVGVALGLPHLPPVRSHLTGLDATPRAPRGDHLKGEAGLLAGEAPSPPAVDPAQQGTGTDVPVLEPEVARVPRLQHRPQEGACLGRPLCTGPAIPDQAGRGLRDHQGFPRQGSGLHRAQHCEASLPRCKTIASPHFPPISWQPRGARPVEVGEQW